MYFCTISNKFYNMRRFYFVCFCFLSLHFAHGADDNFVNQTENKANDEQHKFVNANLFSIKDSIHAFSYVLSPDDELKHKVLYFEFTSFDNIKCFDLFRYILKDKNVIKFCPTKSAFAIVVTNDFNKNLFDKFTATIRLSCKVISKETYLNTLLYIK